MGKRGVHISIGVVLVSAILVLTSFCTYWQHMSAALVFSADMSLTRVHASINLGFLKKVTLPTDLHLARDEACSAGAFKVLNDICDTLTRDYVCGILYMLFAILAIVLDAVAIGYLGFYTHESSQRSYRIIAFNCMAAAPILLGLGVSIYIIAMATGTRGFPGGVRIVFSPGAGFFCAVGATMVLSVVPCLSRTWIASTAEIITEQRRFLKKEAAQQALYGDHESHGEHAASASGHPSYNPHHTPMPHMMVNTLSPMYAQQDVQRTTYVTTSAYAAPQPSAPQYVQTHQIHLQAPTIHIQPGSAGSYGQPTVYQRTSEMYPPPHPSTNIS